MTPVPDWVTQYVAVCVEAFGLHGWRIDIQMERVIDAESPEGVTGRTHLRPRYYCAHMQLLETLEPNDYGYEVITHEMLHIANAPMELSKDRIVELLPDKLQEHAQELFTDADEQITERLAKSLTPVLRKMLKVEK